MSQRVIRVNELLKREISHVLHTRFRGRTTVITITDVDTAANLRSAKVYFSVVGDADALKNAEQFFARFGKEIQREIARVIVLKYLPQLEFIVDRGVERGTRLDSIFEELGLEGTGDKPIAPPPPTEPNI